MYGALSVTIHPMKIYMSRTIVFEYTNHRGEHSTRRAKPEFIQWGSNEYHKDDQWILEALDLDKKAMRSFAMRDMSNVRNVAP